MFEHGVGGILFMYSMVELHLKVDPTVVQIVYDMRLTCSW